MALAGIAIGVALVFAALVANTSLVGSVRELSGEIVGKADFQVSGRSAAGFDQGIVRRVRSIDGAVAAPVAEARVNLRGPRGTRSVLLVGGDPRLKGRRGLLLPPATIDGLGLEVGERVMVQTGTGAASVRIDAQLDRDAFGALAESPVALGSLPRVQELARMRGRVSRIFVDAAPGREEAVERELRRIAGDRLDLAPADRELALFERASYPARASTSLFSALSALVGFLFALNAMLLTVPQRRRLIADLRMAGYAPATAMAVLLVDAVLLGAAGAIVGLLLGDLFSRLLFDSTPDYLASAFAVGSERIVTWQSVALAAIAGVAASSLAVLIPVRGAFSADRGGTLEPGRLSAGLIVGCGLALTGLSLAIAVFAPGLSLAGIAVLLLAMLAFLQGWLRTAAATFGAICRRLRGLVPILAALELGAASSRARTVALAATGAVAAFATIAIGGAQADLQRGLDRIAVDVDRGADVWVAFRGPTNIFGTTAIALPPQQLREIEALPGVRALSRNRGGFLDVGENRAWVLAPAAGRVGPVLRHQVEEGRAAVTAGRLRRGGWVALSQGLAADLDVDVDDRVVLPAPVPTRLRVAALTDNFGWPGGAILMSAAMYRRAWGSRAFSTLGISLEIGARSAEVAAGVRSVLGRGSPLRVETAAERVRRQKDTSRAGLSRLSQISALVLISSVLAMAASMTGLVWQRRPAFAALKVHGLSNRELWRALLLEGVFLLGAGCLAGVLFGLAGQVLLDRALQSITGFPVIYATAAASAVKVPALLTCAAVAVVALPGWLAVRVSPAGLGEL